MDVNELKSLKQKWFQEAVDNGSLTLCYLVGRQLGSDPAGRGYVSTCGPKYTWESQGVEVYVDDYGGYMTVTCNGKRVCSTHGTNRLFVPGEWMEIVRSAAVLARQRKEANEFRHDDDERRRLMDELGISE